MRPLIFANRQSLLHGAFAKELDKSAKLPIELV